MNYSSTANVSASTGTSLHEVYEAIGRLTKTIYVPRVRRCEWDFSGLLRDPEKEAPAFIESSLLLDDDQAYVIAGFGVVASPKAYAAIQRGDFKIRWSLETINVQKWIHEHENLDRESKRRHDKDRRQGSVSGPAGP